MFTLTVGCLVPGVVAGMRRDIPSHEKWMIRFYGSMYVNRLLEFLIGLLG